MKVITPEHVLVGALSFGVALFAVAAVLVWIG